MVYSRYFSRRHDRFEKGESSRLVSEAVYLEKNAIIRHMNGKNKVR